MVNYKKEISRLKEWKNIVEAYSLEIARIVKKNQTIFYSISSVSSETKIKPYTTPIRLSGDKLIAGCIVGSQIEALIVANYVVSSIDYSIYHIDFPLPSLTTHPSLHFQDRIN